jgi:OOP family OmpA-OmpF porin
MKKGLLFLTLLSVFSLSAIAQDKDDKKKADKPAKEAATKSTKVRWNSFSIGAHGGYTLFYGDIRQHDYWPTDNAAERWNFAGGGYINYQLNPVVGFNINVMAGTLGGIKRGQGQTPVGLPNTQKNVKFTTNFVDYTLNASFNPINLMYSDRTKTRWFTTYITAGVGLVSFRTLKTGLYNDAYVNSEGYEWTKDPAGRGKEKAAMTNELVIPVGAGIKFRLSRRFDLGIEYTHRFTFSEKLDATVGNTGTKDSYSYLNLNLAFKFGKNKDSKEWVNPYQALAKNMSDIQANIDGLAQDADGDGVSDLFDKEPGTVADVAVDGSGRALDTDGDGVPDHLDADPFTNKGARVDENGRELDSDADGVADSQDLEPSTPAGNLVNFQGKTINAKGAGDKAPTATGSSSVSSGSNFMSIYFKVNSSRIDYWSSYDKLAEVAKLMKANSGVKVKVVGSADVSGAEDFNKTLAEKRAQAAVDHLVKVYGIDAGRFSVVSDGEAKPLSTSADALNVNRRVDFIAQ